MKTLVFLLVLACIVGLVKSWEWPWQEGKRPWEKPKNPIPSPNPRKFRFIWYWVFEPNLFVSGDKSCRLNLGPAWGGRC